MKCAALFLLLLQEKEVKDEEFNYSLKLPTGWSTTTDVPEGLKQPLEKMAGTAKGRFVKHDRSKTVVLIAARDNKKNPITTLFDFKTFCAAVSEAIPRHYPTAKVTEQSLRRYDKIQGYAIRFHVKGTAKQTGHIDDVRLLYSRNHVYFLQAVWPLTEEAPTDLAGLLDSFALDVPEDQLVLQKMPKDLGTRVKVAAHDFSIQLPKLWNRDTGGERTALMYRAQTCTIEIESEESESDVKAVAERWRTPLEKAGTARNFTEEESFSIGDHAAIQVTYTETSREHRMRVLRTTIRAGDRAYHILCSAPLDEMEFWEDLFKAVVLSFKHEAGD